MPLLAVIKYIITNILVKWKINLEGTCEGILLTLRIILTPTSESGLEKGQEKVRSKVEVRLEKIRRKDWSYVGEKFQKRLY